MADLRGKTIVITGASRGIGRSMALKFAGDGANLVIAAKSSEPHPKLQGTIHTVAEEVRAAGGEALAVQVDVRIEEQVQAMVEAAVQRFGGIDALVNNAGAISLTPVEKTPVKRYDLMQEVNSRAVFVCSQTALPYLRQASNPHILSMAPPLHLKSGGLRDHAPYTLSKYGMTLLSLGMAEEFRKYRIAVNCLWPKTIIATAAIEFAVGDRNTLKVCRKPEIVAEAAYRILTAPSESLTGQILLDEDLLRQSGITDFDRYAYDPDFTGRLHPDLFLDE
ncbi:MAG: SDR family oxidoreductase [Syntrophobacteraceae bacterium]